MQLKARSDEMSEQMRELVNSSYANKQYTSFINLLTDENNLPLLHHCKGGKDRTGFATIITLFILDDSLEKVNISIENNMPEDFYSIDLLDAYESLGSITGETIGEDLVNEIFSKFCMGK